MSADGIEHALHHRGSERGDRALKRGLNREFASRGKMGWPGSALGGFTRELHPGVLARISPASRAVLGEAFWSVAWPRCSAANVERNSYLVDPASSHMLVSKIKPCMSKYKQSIR